ncbi:MAG: 23S rRNA (pseudouridine(1915)-N(3))-methyltransferase RlmH [Bauldia sp.]
MRITVTAIGRLKAGPERLLFQRYFDRAAKAGRGLGLTFAVREFPESRAARPAARMSDEAAAILKALPSDATLVALDETGTNLDSHGFAGRLAKWRQAGVADLAFAIGGADGQGAAVAERADLRLALGSLTWPHQLVRVMLAEQLYRAVTILTGHPYHRD